MSAPKGRGMTGLLLTSEHPQKLVQFYEDTLGLGFVKEDHGGPTHWACSTNGIHFAIHNANGFSEYSWPVTSNSNNSHLFFTIENMEEFLEHLKKIGVEPIGPVENIGPMKMVTAKDSDGRAVMFGTPWN